MGRIGELLQARASALTEIPSVDSPQSRIGAALARRHAASAPTGLEAAARAISASSLAPFIRTPQAIQSEIVRIASAPSFQAYAPAIGALLRQPLETLRLPTSSGVMVGTPAGTVVRELEHQAQGQLGAAFGDMALYEAGALLPRMAAGMTSRIGQALRNRLVTTGRIAPEIIEPAIRRTAITPTTPIQEAEIVHPPRALTFQPGEGIVAEGNLTNVPSKPDRPISPQAPLRSPGVAVRPPSVSVHELASTHPGLVIAPTSEGSLRLPATQLLGDDPELRGKFLIPITRKTADALQDQSVEISQGSLASRVVRIIPESVQHTGQATGLQYWYAFDLPPTTGPSYGKRTVPTPSEGIAFHQPPLVAEPQGKYRATQPLVRVRNQAISAVTRDLFEQSTLLHQGILDLKHAVLRAGGIKPTVGGQLREELQAIRPFLRSTGQPIDTLATELGYEDGEALREALIASRSQTRPTLAQLRQEAVRIVDSDKGNQILDVIQTQGFTSQAVKRMVREVTRETERVISQGSQAVRGILRRAEQKAITPAQLARLARMQRLEPGATVTGPRGGLKEAPLSQPDIAQVEQRVGQVVPRPGQPTGTPPVIPRRTALIPAEVPRPVRDLNQFQSTPFSGLDPSRAAQVIDGTPLGPTERRVIQPLRQGELAMRKEQQAILQDLRLVSHEMRRGSPESHQVFLVLENRVPSGMSISTRVRETAAWMSEQFDRLLASVNQARASVGKQPIIRRQNYISHITDPTFWEAMREAFGNVPDEASVTLSDKFFENLRARGPGFRFGLPRRGGPFQEDAISAFEAYLPAALRVVHLSTPAKLAGVYLDRSLAGTPNAYKYFTLLVRQVATGEAGPIAKLLPGTILRASNWIKGRFGKGTVLGNLSSVIQQVYTLPATVAATGPNASTTAAFWLSRGDGLTFASTWSTVMQSRVMEMDFDLQGLAGRWDAAMAAMFQAADRQMVAHSFLAGYIQAVAGGKDFRAAIEAGDLVAQRTQASFLKADLAPVFRDAFTSSFLQFQNTINGVFNFMKFDIDIAKTRPNESFIRNRFGAAAAFVGTFVGLGAIYESLGLPHPDRLSEIVPGLSTIRTGGGPVGIRLLLSLSHLGSPDAQTRAQAIRDLKNASFAIALGAGGNQFRKSLDGLSAISAGGKFSKTGRLQFPVKGVAESARAVAFGPYQTKAGQAYIQRGFKPEPLSEEQKRLNRAMRNYERSLMR